MRGRVPKKQHVFPRTVSLFFCVPDHRVTYPHRERNALEQKEHVDD